MALSIAQLEAITERKIVPKMHDNIFDSNPLLKRIMNGGSYVSQDGGTTIDVPLNYAATTASGWYSGSDTLSTTDNDNITAARYQWASTYANITITDEDMDKNSGSAGVLKLLASKAMIAEKTLKDNLGTGLYSDGTNTKSIIGLRDIVATDATVGGISQSDYSWWQGQVDSTTTTLTISALNSLFESCSIDNEKPSVILATRANYNRYYNLLQPAQRFMDSETAKGGFTSLMFNSAPFISDSHCPTYHIFMLNENNLKLYYHPSKNVKAMPYIRPVNQMVQVSRIVWMGSLTSSNNRLHGKMSGITA